MNTQFYREAMINLNETSKLMGWDEDFHSDVEMQLDIFWMDHTHMKTHELIDMCAMIASD